jgi:hypothetical protein
MLRTGRDAAWLSSSTAARPLGVTPELIQVSDVESVLAQLGAQPGAGIVLTPDGSRRPVSRIRRANDDGPS